MSVNLLTNFLFLAGLFSRDSSCARREEALDVLEGRDITLKCHYNNPNIHGDNVLYWMRQKHGETDNVAIGGQALDANYRWVNRKTIILF